MKVKRRGRPRGTRVTMCKCGRHVTSDKVKTKRVTCPSCGCIVTVGKRRPRQQSVFEGYLEG